MSLSSGEEDLIGVFKKLIISEDVGGYLKQLLLEQAIKDNNKQLLNYLDLKFSAFSDVSLNLITITAIQSRNVDVILWLHDKCYLKYDKACVWSVKTKQLDLLKTFYQKWQKDDFGMVVIQTAIKESQIEILDWLRFDNPNWHCGYVSMSAASCRKTEILSWLIELGFKEEVFYFCVNENTRLCIPDDDILEWLLER